MTVALAARQVCAHRRGRQVLHDVDLEVQQGEVVALLGPNGAGKSTLLDVLSGQLPPSSGSVTTSGRVATALQSPDLARQTARANVELALQWWGVPKQQRHGRAVKALEVLRAEHLADRPASAMSGGERRRVHLARALALEPDVLLLDEPFAGLDVAARGRLLEDTASALRCTSPTVVVVVHDREEAWALASRLVVVLDGTIAADGPPQQVLESPPTAAVARFLGFTGELVTPAGLVLTRPSHARLDEHGELVGTVTRRVPQEDAVLLDASVPTGHLQVRCPYPGPAVGDAVHLSLSSAVATFPP